MKEIKTILKAYDKLNESGQKAALATVVRVEESSYRRTGARMLVLDNGIFIGGISGGCLEGDALRRAQKAIATGKPTLVTYDTTEDDKHQIGVGLGCNGVIDVLLTPLSYHADARNDKDKNGKNSLDLLKNYTEKRSPSILFTVTRANEDSYFQLGETFTLGQINSFGTHKTPIEKEVEAVLVHKKSKIIPFENFNVLIEFLPPVVHLVLFGGNYDVLPLARMGRELGWKVSVVTNINKAQKGLFEVSDQVLDKTADVPIDAYTAFVFMSHDYKTDLNLLKKYAPTKVSYIGMLGPRKRAEKVFNEMADEGLEIPHDRIFAPVGLDIGATTPEAIALSILAEIQTHFGGRSAKSLKYREGSIHER
jgi:xanthine dehydrogenase accessory factor